MPANMCPRRERTDDWQKIRQYTFWPEQKVYELLRPVVLFNESAAERAREIGGAERSVRQSASQFEEHGMTRLFPQTPKEQRKVVGANGEDLIAQSGPFLHLVPNPPKEQED